eukprot:GFYU01000548.1.p1 GENE.GFYU01000548.1~~GFYU01000548.1.p1  ORF type:complete len:327 (+),score=76.68 GFYU01000548.1:29-982(+)
MGQAYTKAKDAINVARSNKPSAEIFIQGLDAAGKTTMLYKVFKSGIETTIPTIGWMIERVTYRNISFSAWDTGGRCNWRPLWRHYYAQVYKGNVGLVYMFDCNDRERMDDAIEEMRKNLGTMATCFDHEFPVLVFANKQDLPRAMSHLELESKLRDAVFKGRDRRSWLVQPSVATVGDGLYEGLDWLSTSMKASKDGEWKTPSKGLLSRTWNEMWAVAGSLAGQKKVESRESVNDENEKGDLGEVEDLRTEPEGGVGPRDKLEMSRGVEKKLNSLIEQELSATEIVVGEKLPELSAATHLDMKAVDVTVDPNHALAA